MSSDGTQGPVLVHGIKPDNPTNPPVRMEVRDMIKDYPDQWNLYLLGLERFQNSVNEELPLSYFEIAGIHGLPYKKWPDRNWNNKMVRVENRFGGFCTHSSILFLTWHRPYLALFEAELYKHVNAVADEFEESERKADYVKAAKDFRMPYWDWARPDLGVFPTQATSQAEVQVKRPHGKQQDSLLDPNPLASYKFGEKSRSDRSINRASISLLRAIFHGSDEDGQFPRLGGTVRYPGEFNNEELMQQLTSFFAGNDPDRFSRGKNLTERVMFILQSYRDFGSASHNRFNPPKKQGQPNFAEWGSIEDIHNAIHTYAGGGGHMSDPTVAAFDPIFWLHHTNIDRLFAIWQACHDNPNDPSTYVTDQYAGTGAIGGNFTVKAGGPETINTPLAPFARSGTKDNQVFWTSEGVRYTNEFGYLYPETQKSKFPTREAILNELDRLYGRNASLANILRTGDGDFQAVSEEFRSRAKAHLQVAKPSTVTAAAVPAADQAEQKPLLHTNGSADTKLPDDRDLKKLVGADNKYLEWLVNIKAEKAELGGNYVVHVFLGDPDDDTPLLYVTNHSHVGAFATFGQNEDTACRNCQEGRASGQRITGQIPLTIALAERYVAGLVESLTPEHVIPYLQKNLHWRVTLSNGEPRPRSQLNNLLISVVTNKVTVPRSPTDLPLYADDVTPWPEATTKRNGGGRGDGTGYDGTNF
ncbi:tyrosinase precursor [Colletotrichum incanum]|uniref:tyrosinase n=1 Tax=Colletotrichum incanum TaxID=1573173 RepID=A0A167BY34_COLIC|nr:tyrosinase precursor [Colletotrichum incanum]OHW91390.1 tyrosinase precursor [Colletotrichum incanum]